MAERLTQRKQPQNTQTACNYLKHTNKPYRYIFTPVLPNIDIHNGHKNSLQSPPCNIAAAVSAAQTGCFRLRNVPSGTAGRHVLQWKTHDAPTRWLPGCCDRMAGLRNNMKNHDTSIALPAPAWLIALRARKGLYFVPWRRSQGMPSPGALPVQRLADNQRQHHGQGQGHVEQRGGLGGSHRRGCRIGKPRD